MIQPLENIRIESSGKRLGLIYREFSLGKPEKVLEEYADEVEGDTENFEGALEEEPQVCDAYSTRCTFL